MKRYRISDIVFFQNDEDLRDATGCSVFNETDKEIFDQLKEWHFPGDRFDSRIVDDRRDGLGTSDNCRFFTEEPFTYRLSYNSHLGYAGLSIVEEVSE